MGVLCLVLALLCVTKFSYQFLNYLDEDERAGHEVKKPEFILKLKIKHNDWLLVDKCPQAANYNAVFYNLEASFVIILTRTRELVDLL